MGWNPHYGNRIQGSPQASVCLSLSKKRKNAGGFWYGCKGLGGLQASGGSAGKKQGIQFEQLVGTQCTAIFSTAEQAVYSAEGRV